MAEVRSLQSQLHNVNGRSASGDRIILPLSSMSEVLPFFITYFVIESASSLSLLKFFPGFAVNQALSASAVHNSLIPRKKTVRTLYFWCSFAQLE